SSAQTIARSMGAPAAPVQARGAAPAAGPAPAPAAPAPPSQATHGSSMVLGIDLGTTYSCAAFMRDGLPDVVPMDAGYRTLPSVVTITANEQVVGRAAYDRIATHPKNT